MADGRETGDCFCQFDIQVTHFCFSMFTLWLLESWGKQCLLPAKTRLASCHNTDEDTYTTWVFVGGTQSQTHSIVHVLTRTQFLPEKKKLVICFHIHWYNTVHEKKLRWNQSKKFSIKCPETAVSGLWANEKRGGCEALLWLGDCFVSSPIKVEQISERN